ncbi:Glycoside hydrolase family 115 protein [Pleurostoma richardsiae]|uniref:Glycoside hydrolase family 115 protein n=1 Tax=Pleurostoma richardsiae TaxID=41990 RepID=A0AA38R3I3_9PEZI|nr:Glycoside hydrolase family 115 protein [Pleurostoma richardsiae]
MKTCLFLALTGAASLAAALGQQPIVTFANSTGTFQIAGDSVSVGQILVSSNDYWGVIRAAQDLALDFGRVTGTNYTLSSGVNGSAPVTYQYKPVNNKNNTFYTTTSTQNLLGPNFTDFSASSVVVIAGTIGHSTLIDNLVSAGTLDVRDIDGQWESFVSQLVRNPAPGVSQALVIAGSDPRGTIYGIYDISEQIGVSPWYFWADVPVTQNAKVYVLPDRKVQGPPSVKYRGFFLNDEQPGLTNWVASNFPDAASGAAGYGPGFYSLLFELLLRLRANYLWPTIWGSMFEVDFPENQPLADAYEIVLGSSHTEPLMRAQNEFGTFYKGPWAYNLNNATIDDYFRYGVERARPYARNSLWTMGMRGTGDTAIEGLGVDAIVSMLETLVANQQRIIVDGLDVNISTVPQMWCLYKEVQTYIFEGLEVPEDITLLWSDDNWGNVRRLPLRNETDRPGGAGIYYHFDYVGDPRNYKWINTVQLAKTAEQMHMAYSRGADRIWIVNVGDLKPLEIPISHFLDMAYDTDRWGVDTSGDWAAAWGAREFGPELAANISDLVVKYGMYANRRKFELVEPETYSVINYNEADAVLEQWALLAEQALAVYEKLNETAQPAFFQMILHPIQAGEIVYKIYIGAAKNLLYAGQKRNSANDVINAVLNASTDDANLTSTWDRLLDGKWEHMLDQTHLGYDGYWQQPMRNTLPAMSYVQTAFVSLAGHVGVGVEGSNATVQGDDKYHSNSGNNLAVPPLDPYGPITRYFDVFSRGTNSCTWTASPWQPWVKLSQYNGTVGPQNGTDSRVYISIDWDDAPPAPNVTIVNINITNGCRAAGFDKYAYSNPMVQIPVQHRYVPSNFTEGFIESDGHVSILGPHYQTIVRPPSNTSLLNASSSSSSATKNVTYHTFADLTRTGDGVGLWPQNTDKLTIETAPALEYQLYLFSNSSAANVTVFISPSHNYLGDQTPLSYAIALYPTGGTPKPVTVTPVGRTVGAALPDGWGYAVADGVWGRVGNYTTSRFNVTQEGAYTLRIWALVPSVIVHKVVVDMGGVRPSYLGPPESFLLGRDAAGKRNGTSFENEVGTLGGTGDGNATRVVAEEESGGAGRLGEGPREGFVIVAMAMLAVLLV